MTSGRRAFSLLLGLAVISQLYMGFRPTIYPIMPGLDASWVFAYHYAAVNGLRWGQDFISTYGPYGHLVYTMDLGSLATQRIAFDLALALGSGIISALYVSSANGLRLGTRAALVLLLTYAISLQHAEYRWFAPFVLLSLIGVRAEGRAGLIANALAGVLAGFYLLVKFSLGLGAVTAALVSSLLVGYPLLAARRFAVTVLMITAGLGTGWIAHGGGLNGLASYLASGWHLTSGYSSAMSLASPPWWIAVASIVVFSVLLGLWVLRQRTDQSLVSLLGLAVPLFVVWKHAIVRQDHHVRIFVIFGIFVLVILLIDRVEKVSWRRILRDVGVLLIPLLVPWFQSDVGGLDSGRAWRALGETLTAPVRLPPRIEVLKLIHFQDHRQALARMSEQLLSGQRLPTSTLKILGRAPVDIYPWELSYIPANGLTWSNRPLPASFSAYTPALDDRNASFFASPDRPDYLIWHTDLGVHSIDGRHLFWDEPRTLRTILNRYEVTESENRVWLLRARPAPRFGRPEPLGQVDAKWRRWIPVPQTYEVVLAEVTFRRSPVARLARLLFREGPVSLSLRSASGDEVTYRLVPDNVKNGLWISPFPVTPPELLSVLQGGPARRVVAIRFRGDAVTRSASSLSISWFRLAVVHDAPSSPHDGEGRRDPEVCGAVRG